MYRIYSLKIRKIFPFDSTLLKFTILFQTCDRLGVDSANSSLINAWEFVLEPKHGLIWCNVFKAASSTWYYNFNILAGEL